MSGWIKVDRDLRESLPFAKDKFSRYEAWLDLVGLANWEDKIWVSKKGPVEVKRGSFITSLSYLSERWKWSKSAVRCFLNSARTAAQIAHAVRTDYTLITIVDYDRYQPPTETNARSTHGERTDCSTDSARTAAPTKEIINKEIRSKKEEEGGCKGGDPQPTASEHTPSDEINSNFNLRNSNVRRIEFKKPKPKPDKVQHGEFVFLTTDEHSGFLTKYGPDFLQAAIEKLNGWIGSNPIPKRVTNGRNAAATFRAWVFNAIAEDQARAQRTRAFTAPKMNHTERTIANMNELIAKFEAEEALSGTN